MKMRIFECNGYISELLKHLKTTAIIFRMYFCLNQNISTLLLSSIKLSFQVLTLLLKLAALAILKFSAPNAAENILEEMLQQIK